MDRRTDEQKSPRVLQDFVPFGAAAQKKKFRHTKKLDFIIFGPQIEVDRHRPEIKILAKNANDAE